MSTILNKIQDCMENESMTLRDVKSLCGKLIDIRCLNPDFKYYLSNLIGDSSNSGSDMNTLITLSDWSRQDLHWWLNTLPIVIGGKIPMTDLSPNPKAIRIYTDAAGGSSDSKGRGIGACIFPGIWAQIKHGQKTNEGW